MCTTEEVGEVAEVKKALVEHLEMDPKITLGVLCDQIVPWDEAADEEEISIRKRLRSLVLAFMAKEAKGAICERYANPGESGELVLYEGLFAVRRFLMIPTKFILTIPSAVGDPRVRNG